ncbi:MAG: hypothetical protein KAJ55_06560 [Anaerolineales bacterium]|nr:hypothetical protein [Anaerolineales bacterium]
MIVEAVLIKQETEDGLFEMWEDVPLGKFYTVDNTTIRMAHGYNGVKHKHWYMEIVNVVEGEDVVGFMPTELLKIEGVNNAKKNN